ncbi:dihydrodipicolinate synthase family protein [Actinoplanes sp. NPDC051851]|uniref:dihydrodipicolinate synthase family protein n=1 Tax=Actinoplanes sp. NPDC051851 TaxID=3154753 RepID=UPI0034301347
MEGVYVPLITPYRADGTIAYDVLEDLARDMLLSGATGLVALSTTGEAAMLSPAERHGVLDSLSRVCARHGAPLLAGGTLAELATFPEVTAALSLVPPFHRPGPDGVIAHFTALACASPVPIVVYHVPARTGQPLDATTLRRLAAIDGVLGIKYATGTVDTDLVTLLADPPPGFAVLCGDDTFLAPMLALGASGGILASAHLATTDYADLVTAWQTGDLTRARPLTRKLAPLSTALFAEPNPTVLKSVLYAHGRIPTPAVRLPLVPASEPSVDAALAAAQHLTASTT